MNYVPKPDRYDEAFDAEGRPRGHWERLALAAHRASRAAITRRAQTIRRAVEQHGVTYNIYGDPQGAESFGSLRLDRNRPTRDLRYRTDPDRRHPPPLRRAPDGQPAAPSHTAVAAAVFQRRADWGLAIEPAAREYGLGFIPVRDERFDFIVPEARHERPAVAAFRAVLAEPATRSALQTLGFQL